MGGKTNPDKPPTSERRKSRVTTSQTTKTPPYFCQEEPIEVPVSGDLQIQGLEFADKVNFANSKNYLPADKVSLNYNAKHSCWVASVTYKKQGKSFKTNMSSDNYYICEKGKRGTKDHYLKFWWKHQDPNRGWFCKRSSHDRYLRVAGGGLSDFYRLITSMSKEKFDVKNE